MRRLLLTCSLLLLHLALRAQQPVSPTDLRIIPPSPEAAKLTTYGQVPVGYYTGSMNVSIPLAHVADGPLQVPVSLSYNSTGNKVDEVASWVGLGWSLNAGGAITRTAHGWADDAHIIGSSLSFLELIQQRSIASIVDEPRATARAESFYRLSRGCWDGEPDVFSFNFNGYTGQFAFGWDGQLRVQSDKPVHIEPQYDSQHHIQSWRVTVSNGTVYTFAAREYTVDRRALEEGSRGCKPGFYDFVSAWYLSSVEDVNAEHRIELDYDRYNISYSVKPNESVQIGNRGTLECSGLMTIGGGAKFRLDFNSVRLQRIRASHGAQVVFTAGALRADTLGLTGPDNYNLRSLARVSEQDATGREVSARELTYGYPTSRLTLLQVQQVGQGGQRLPPHKLTYSGALPDDVRSTAQDHWGYSNGASNTTLRPTIRLATPPSDMYILPGGDREVHPEYTQAGLLTRIVYPTGGRSEFVYESNEASFVHGQLLSSLGAYPMEDVEVEVMASPYSTPAVPLGSCRTNTQTFTVAPIPGAGAPAPRSVKFLWQGYNPGAFGNARPTIRLVRPDGTAVLHTLGAGPGTYMPTPVEEELGLMPGTYTLEVYACNPQPTYDNNPDIETYGHPYAWAKVKYQNPAAQPRVKMLAGGVRLKEVRDYTQANGPAATTRRFAYHWQDDLTVSSGAIADLPNYHFTGSNLYRITSLPADAIVYDQCTYLMIMARSSGLLATQGSYVGYRQVTVTTVGPAATGKTVYRYTSPAEYMGGGGTTLPVLPDYVRTYMTGLLTEQVDYASHGNGFAPVKRVWNDYTDYTQDLDALVVHAPNAANPNLDFVPSAYSAGIYHLPIGFPQLHHTRQTQYSPDGTAHQADTYFEYDPTGRQLLAERSTRSDGRQQVTSHHYLNLYAHLSPALADAVSRHAWPEVETVTTIERPGEAFVVGSTYQAWEMNAGKLRSRSQYRLATDSPITKATYRFSATDPTARRDDRLQEQVTVERYDAHGNVVQVRPHQGTPIARLWGYAHDQWLLAEVQGARYDQVAATSFEPASPGRWTYAAAAVTSGGAHTGAWSYVLNPGADLQLPDALPSGQYELTCWSSAAPQLVDATQAPVPWQGGAQGPADAAGLRFFRFRFAVTAGWSALRLIGTSIRLDDARLYPVGAQMTTLTHAPLIGVTSQTDPTGRTTTHEYDAFGRLQRVRDEQGRVLSENEYRYARP